MFVSNSDNLGATLDLDLLAYFASENKGFLMEVWGGWGSTGGGKWGREMWGGRAADLRSCLCKVGCACVSAGGPAGVVPTVGNADGCTS